LSHLKEEDEQVMQALKESKKKEAKESLQQTAPECNLSQGNN